MSPPSRRVYRLAVSVMLGSVLAISASGASASDPAGTSPQSVIETRQAGFKKMGAAMKAIVEQLKSAAPDNARLAAAARALDSGAEAALHWFPGGSGPEAGVDTDALPHIWEDRAKFDSIANQLLPETKALAAVAVGTDLAAIRTQVKVVADLCASCHRSFRAD